MIQITRLDPPSQLRLAGDLEKKLAINHFEVHKSPESFKFKVYSKDYVKIHLLKMFNGKCAYCESYLPHTQHPHIEHWRPKGKVTEDEDHKGYYWLAADWENLFIACGVCNSSYKLNKFPLKEGSTYAKLSSDNIHELEKPLLINPCTDNPEPHLGFTLYGKAIGLTDEGEKSIEVYGLNREDLEDRRRFIARHVVCSRLDDIIADISEFQLQPNKLIARVSIKVKELNYFMSAKSEYSAMTKCIIKEYRNKSISKFFLEITKKLLEDNIK
ncbi:retron system putative HNH endonuclease [Priestia megaterium]|uniref:retron system putative HNH endonuclease n=1 Tax=Priestia megaterium TaxID=1404 RepID=UPI00203C2997|nr:retron system putative HNH endonuclease [Priestia megaterium]MCM3195825.1 TIGR02646 family protein [Priestia megaterium]